MGAYELALHSLKSNHQLSNEITHLAGQINAATYRLIKLIAEFDQREAWAEAGHRSCAHWLNLMCGIAMGAAREKVRVARCLEDLPQINQAFSLGMISYSKVRAMTRVATNENEDYLIMIAKSGTASHTEKLVSKFQRVKQQIKATEEPQQTITEEDARQVVSYQDDDGMWLIKAKLTAETGALVVKAIDAIVREQITRELQENEQKNVSAETFSDEQTSNALSFPQRKADALATMAEHYLATIKNDTGIKTLAGSERCQLILHVDINTLRSKGCSHQTTANKHCNLDNQHWIKPETAKRLSCDASLVTVMEDGEGNVLNIGRRSRTIPPSIQRALNLRDLSCRYPGCCTTNYLDAHHIKHWADGGATRLDNLLMLCRHHHRALHNNGFTIRVNDSQIVFTSAKGVTIEQSCYPQFADAPRTETESKEYLETQWPFITAKTAVSNWRGESMDYDMAIDRLLR